MTTTQYTSITLNVEGRPAPQGSKKFGAHGQLLEASAYLRPWRAAVRRAAFERYAEWGVSKAEILKNRLIPGPVRFGAIFWMPRDHRIDSPPDLDKLLRATWDALTSAGVWEDDGRVIGIDFLEKQHAPEDRPTGADIFVRATTMGRTA